MHATQAASDSSRLAGLNDRRTVENWRKQVYVVSFRCCPILKIDLTEAETNREELENNPKV